jgi:hypothetical protein
MITISDYKYITNELNWEVTSPPNNTVIYEFTKLNYNIIIEDNGSYLTVRIKNDRGVGKNVIVKNSLYLLSTLYNLDLEFQIAYYIRKTC